MTINLTHIPLLLLSISFFLMFFLDEKQRKSYLLATIVRLVLIIIATSILNDSRLIKMYPDQKFYLETAESISKEISISGFLIDYKSIIGLHNGSYNVFGGILLYFNGGVGSLMIYRSLNFLLHSIIVIISTKFFQEYNDNDDFKTSILIFCISLLPSYLIYSILALRELLLTLCITLFIFGLKKKNIPVVMLSIFLSYYTRKQLLLVYITAMIVAFILSLIIKMKKRSIHKVILLIFFVICIYFIFPILFPKYSYLIDHFKIISIINFLREFILGLFGIAFLFHRQTGEVSKISLLLNKLMTPEIWIIPLIFIYYAVKTKFNSKLVRLLTVIILMYCFGYYVEFGLISTRYIIIFYPLMIIISLWNTPTHYLKQVQTKLFKNA